MKKIGIMLLTSALAATALSGCAPKSPDLSMPTDTRTETGSAQTEIRSDARVEPEVEQSFGFSRYKIALPGGFRKAPDPSGNYVTEYVHVSQYEAATTVRPDYSLELKDDNTFSFRADVNGVHSEHYGNWYLKRGGSIMLFYDEPIDRPAHNEYYSDSMYMELIPGGKIMFYDNCATVVLSRADTEQNANS